MFDWHPHITQKHADANRALGLLNRTLFCAPPAVKCLAHKTLCRPKLKYAVEVWDPFLTKHVNLLEMLQNRAVRFISDIKERNGVSDAKKLLNLDPLAHRRKHNSEVPVG